MASCVHNVLTNPLKLLARKSLAKCDSWKKYRDMCLYPSQENVDDKKEYKLSPCVDPRKCWYIRVRKCAITPA